MNERLGFTSDETSIAVSALRGYANLQEAMAQNLEENATEDFLATYQLSMFRRESFGGSPKTTIP